MRHIFASAIFICGLAAFAFGQNINTQNTKNTADQTLRSAGRVNPSTLGMEFDLPLGSYASRGFSLPLGLSYSSKVWRFQDDQTIQGTGGVATRVYVYGAYSDNAASGWSSSLTQPYIEYTGEFNRFDDLGRPLPGEGSSGLGVVGDKYIRRITVFLPDGSSHEMRPSGADGPIVSPTPPNPYPPASAWDGTFFASDGSGLKYVQNATSSLYRMYLPDGSFWDFNATREDHTWTTQIRRGTRLTDVHGNHVQFSAPDGTYPNGSWTDQLGRVFPVMMPREAPQMPGGSEIVEQEFTLPGMSAPYSFTWKRLKGSTSSVSAFTNFYTQTLHYVGGTAENGTNPTQYSPALFASGNTMGQGCSGDNSNLYVANLSVAVFNPVVLAEITLPTGASYKFSYNHFGEIERIIYPTGGHEEFTYGAVASLSNMDPTYEQTNRGVTVSKVYENDSDPNPAISSYSAKASANNFRTSVIAPDGMQTDNFMHRGIPMATCSQVDYPTFINTYGTRWGYDNPLAGRTYETRVYSSGTPHIVQRTITKWDATTTTQVIRNYGPEYLKRNVRVHSTQSITYEGDQGLHAITKFEYDTDKDDVGSPLNVTAKREYTYQVISSGGNSFTPATPTEVPPSAVTTISDPTSGLTAARTTETTYKTDSTYKNQNLLRLPTQVLIKDGSGNTKAKSTITYDEGTYLVSDSVSGVPGWTNLGTNVRGLPTTSTMWHDIGNNLSLQTHIQYNQFGNATKNWDANGNLSQTEYADCYYNVSNPSVCLDYSTYAFPTKTISPIPGGNGSTSTFEGTTKYYFNSGLPAVATDINGQKTTIEYNDALLRPTKVIAPNLQEAITEYGAGTDSSSRWVKVKSQIDASSWKEGYTWYDGLMRSTKTQSVDPTTGDVFVDMQYDNMGRVKKASNPYRAGETIYWSETTFDSAGRPWKVTTLGDNASVETTYAIATSGSCIGTAVTFEDQADKQRRAITNALGQLCRVDEPTTTGTNLGSISSPNQPTSYSYDFLDNLTNVTQGSQTRTLVYDAMSRLKSASNPESGTVTYSYDNNGNLTGKTDARPVTTTYTYDTLNRIQTRSYNDGTTPTVTYYYDTVANAKGKLIKVANSVSTTEYTAFDILGRVTAHKQTTDGTAYTTGYTYDLAGNLREETYPSTRVVKNILDNNGDLALVESKENVSAGYWPYANSVTFTAAGAIRSMQLGNGKWESTTFNSRLQPIQIALGITPNATDLLDLDFTYGTTNNNGNVLSQTITVPGLAQPFIQNYSYDGLNRLASATETNNGSQTWTQGFGYDRYGNRNVSSGTGVTNFSFSGNRITGHSYDAAGNMTNDGTRTFTFDAENKQTAVSSGAIGQYWYDGDGKRVKKYIAGTGETAIFVYDALGKLVAEYSTNVIPAQNAKVAYLTNDHLGSPRVNTDANGIIASRHDYHPFGEEILSAQRTTAGYAADTVREQFTGYKRDLETYLDFAQARMYGAPWGRFTSPDPSAESAHRVDPQSWNRYVYALNNPLRYTDLLGENYEDLSARQRKIIDDWAGSQNATNGTNTSAQQMYDALGEDRRAAYESITNALENTTIIGRDGTRVNGLDIVSSLTIIAGEKPAGNDDAPSFRIYVELKEGMADFISTARTFGRTQAHPPEFPRSRQQKDGAPGLQISMSQDGTKGDIDVDYESKKLYKIIPTLCLRHCTEMNSDVRAQQHFEKHNKRYGNGQAGPLKRRYEPTRPK